MPRKIYPLTADDMAAALGRPTDLNIPIREDVRLTNGTVIPAMLSWGSPAYYAIQVHNGKFYGAPAPYIGDNWEPA